jgi:hypothetical protein
MNRGVDIDLVGQTHHLKMDKVLVVPKMCDMELCG